LKIKNQERHNKQKEHATSKKRHSIATILKEERANERPSQVAQAKEALNKANVLISLFFLTPEPMPPTN
jgi:CRISPR/Cas system-associated endonuclease Cas1